MAIKNHVIITGMHRSGTSFLVRGLNLCGLNLGPESDFFDTEIQPKFGNPKGHWENAKITKLNDEILKINGGSWHKVPLNLNKTPKDLGKKIRLILEPFYETNALAYGFKDPRLCLTLNKWKKILPKVVVVGIFRHPLKVAESLKKRDGFNYDESIKLWKTYNESLIRLLKKNKSFLIDFDWPQKKLFEQTKLIASKIGLAEIDISDWYSDSYKKSDKSFESNFHLPNDVIKIYDTLKSLSKKNKLVRFSLPKKDKKQYVRILTDQINSSNRSYVKTLELAQKNSGIQQKTSLKSIKNSPLLALLSLYQERKDLQKKFPEVLKGKLLGLIEWALNISTTDVKGEIITKQRLAKHSRWYSNFKTDSQLWKNLEQKNNK